MKLHQRGVDLLIRLRDALTHIDTLSEKEIRDLAREGEQVLRHLFARDLLVRDEEP